MAQFYEDLSSDSLAPVYILSSQEPLLLGRAETAITNACVPKDLRSFNVDHLDGKTDSAEQILATLQTLPMMASRRLLVVRRLDAMASAELAKLLPYLADPNPTTVWIGICGKVDKRIKFFQRLKKAGYLRELTAPKSLSPWIQSEAKKRNIELGNGTARRLADVIGSDLSRLGLALEQLSLFVGERAIESDDVDELVADTRERSVFELTDAIGGGDLARALSAVAALFEQRQSSIGVLMMLGRHMRQVGLCQAGIAERLGGAELGRRVGAPPFVVDRLSQQARRYSVRAVATTLSLLAEADRALKGADQSTKVLGRALAERVIVERLVTKLIALAR